MEKDILEEYIKSGLSLNQIVKKTGKCLTTIRYWANKHNLKSNFERFKKKEPRPVPKSRSCPRCKEETPINSFYSRRGIKNASTYCKTCTNLQVVERQRAFKKQCVEYKGGKCESKDCSTPGGYSRHLGGLEFHHLDPTKKDFNISHVKGCRFNDLVKEELDKCLLLCACCHREEHGKKYCR